MRPRDRSVQCCLSGYTLSLCTCVHNAYGGPLTENVIVIMLKVIACPRWLSIFTLYLLPWWRE